ncbi:MAG TPA: hypothetical protein VFU74_03450, partial [Actinocrinis sp.]|nr:hypothetical protein [Actinocrinis sp.]
RGQRDGLVLRDRAAIEAEMVAVVDRAPNAEQAVTAVRAIRRRELFRIVAADLLGLLDGEAGASVAGGVAELRDRIGDAASSDALDRLGRALTDVTAATIEAALTAVVAFRAARADRDSSGNQVSDGAMSGDGASDGGASDGGAADGAVPGGDPSVTGALGSGAVGAGVDGRGASGGDVPDGGVPGEGASSSGPDELRDDSRGDREGNLSDDNRAEPRGGVREELPGGARDASAGERAGSDAWRRLPTRLAVIAMGRFGGGELGYGSDADVMFVHEPVDGADEHQASAVAFELANELRRLLQAPGTDPPLAIDTDLRPEGRQGPLVRSLASYAEYYRRWSRVWESQALLRAAPIAGAKGVGARFVALIDPIRYPEKGLPDTDVIEIRRLKARMEAERLPRGADRALHTKLGPGGLSDVEWVVQLLQLRYGAQVPALRVTGTRAALTAATAAGLIGEDDRSLLDDAWYQTTRMRNGITLVRGRPGDQVPTGARDLAVIARYLDSWHRAAVPAAEHGPGPNQGPGAGAAPWESGGTTPALGGLLDRHRADKEALLDAHRRRARRARGVFERLFYG